MVEAVEKGVNGCQVKSITSDGAITKDGNIKVGDYITTINNESLRRITNAQARAIIRRASLLGTDIRYTLKLLSIKYSRSLSSPGPSLAVNLTPETCTNIQIKAIIRKKLSFTTGICTNVQIKAIIKQAFVTQ